MRASMAVTFGTGHLPALPARRRAAGGGSRPKKHERSETTRASFQLRIGLNNRTRTRSATMHRAKLCTTALIAAFGISVGARLTLKP